MRRRNRLLGLWAFSILTSANSFAIAQEDAEPEPPVEEALPAEEPAEAPVEEETGLSLTQPPPAGKGAVAGIVRETKLGDVAIEAFVGIVGTKTAVLTEVDGSFRLELPPGKYQLQVSYELHKPVRISDVTVTAGKITRIDVKLTPEEGVEEAIETVVEIDKQSVEGLLLERQRSAASGDSIGRAEIVKSNDRNAAEAAKRVVGANIEGSRFLFVRGLGERYTNALLDGFPLPSPEPDRQAVPLDLFPAQILESLTVVKTFTPDVPGDFAGGSVRIVTRRIPNKLTLAGSLSLGFNTQATFADFLTYNGGSADFLGIDDGTRALPDDFPDSKVIRGVERPNGDLITRDDIKGYGKELNTSMTARRTLGPPNHSGNVVVANSWPLGSWGRVGVMAALVYDRRFERRVDATLGTYRNAVEGEDGELDGLKPLNSLSYERGTDKVSWGGLAGVTLEIGDDHELSLTGLHTRSSDSEAGRLFGRHDERSASLQETRLSFVSRALTFGEFSGKHKIKQLGNLEVEYGIGIARATRDEPDTRGSTYQYDGTQDVFAFEDDSTSGAHFYSEQGETTYSGKLDLTQPLREGDLPAKVKFGGAVNVRDREFLARRFRFRPDRDGAPAGFDTCPGPDFAIDCQDKLFTDSNIDGGFLELEENTRENDGYRAGLNVFAGYAMFDGALTKQLRFIIGPRVEISQQTITPFDPVNLDLETETSELNEVAILPSASLIYSPLSRANLRASLTRTVARPQLRELAPFAYADYFGGREIRGNIDLENTSIINADTRFEYFPSSREVLAVSAFYKRFEDPIEQVLLASSGRGVITFDNAIGGNLFGVEFEARKSLDMFAKALRPFTVIANLTLAHSRVDLDPVSAVQLTSQSRPLSLQAPYIVNAAIDFDEPEWGTRARLLYNVVGPRLYQVGSNGIPDIYEVERHVLDLSVGQEIGKHVEIRGAVTNLIDSPVRRAHDTESGDNVTEEYRLGRTFSIGVALTY